MAAEHDEQCPAAKVREAAALAKNAKLSVLNNTHFDMYLGETLEVRYRQGRAHSRPPPGRLNEEKKNAYIHATDRTPW